MILYSSQKNKFLIYTHIQKCAGMFIAELFKFNASYHHYCSNDRHATLSEDIQFLKDKKISTNEVFSFTCIRNPWDRIVSFYHFSKQTNYANFYELCNKYCFSDFLKFSEENHKKIPAFQTYKSRICHENKIAICFFVNFHNLIYDLNKIVKIKHNLKKINISEHECYKFYYNSTSEDIIRNIFKEDIEQFNFSFDKTSQLKKPTFVIKI